MCTLKFCLVEIWFQMIQRYQWLHMCILLSLGISKYLLISESFNRHSMWIFRFRLIQTLLQKIQFPMRCKIFFGILLIFVNFVLSSFLKKFVLGQVKDFITFSPNPSIIYTSKLTKLLRLQQITNKSIPYFTNTEWLHIIIFKGFRLRLFQRLTLKNHFAEDSRSRYTIRNEFKTHE